MTVQELIRQLQHMPLGQNVYGITDTSDHEITSVSTERRENGNLPIVVLEMVFTEKDPLE